MSNKELNVINIESADRSASRTNHEYNDTFDRIDDEINIHNDDEILIRSDVKGIDGGFVGSDGKVMTMTDSKKNFIKINEDDQLDKAKRDLIDDFI